jgi:hypothetical protein
VVCRVVAQKPTPKPKPKPKKPSAQQVRPFYDVVPQRVPEPPEPEPSVPVTELVKTADLPIEKKSEPVVAETSDAESNGDAVNAGEVNAEAVHDGPKDDTNALLTSASEKLDEATAAVSGQLAVDEKVGATIGDGVKREETPIEPSPEPARRTRVRRRVF